MKTLTLPIHTDTTIIISRKRKPTDTAQQDMFATYRAHWLEQYVALIRSMPRPVMMSAVRVEAGKRGMAAPVSKNWYGMLMRSAGLKCTGVDKSPLKSRRGGWEAKWE